MHASGTVQPFRVAYMVAFVELSGDRFRLIGDGALICALPRIYRCGHHSHPFASNAVRVSEAAPTVQVLIMSEGVHGSAARESRRSVNVERPRGRAGSARRPRHDSSS